MVTRMRLNTSGGVITAATTSTTTMACRRYFLMNSGVTTPIRDRKKTTIGSSKVTPAERATDVTEPIYDVTLIWLVTTSLTRYVPRKLIESGVMMK